jgi:NADP-dependent 3-hydroxy acid dehydrogenase YdfG
MDLNLSGQIAVITGGASRISRASARAFAAEPVPFHNRLVGGASITMSASDHWR